MSLSQLFASRRTNHRHQREAEEEGVAMLRRLQELREVTELKPVETLSTQEARTDPLCTPGDPNYVVPAVPSEAAQGSVRAV
jgi:hypothetical protein